MGELLLPRPSQQSLPCGGSTYPQAAASVAVHQTQSEMAGEGTFPDGILLPSAWSGQSYRTDRQPSVGETVSFLRALDAGNPHVQCDEREQETELCQTGLRRRRESLANGHREAKVTAPVLDSTRHGIQVRQIRAFCDPITSRWVFKAAVYKSPRS